MYSLSTFSAFPMPSMILFKLPLFIAGMLIYKAVSEHKKIYILIAMIAPFIALVIKLSISYKQVIIEEMLILGMMTLLIEHKSQLPVKEDSRCCKKSALASCKPVFR